MKKIHARNTLTCSILMALSLLGCTFDGDYKNEAIQHQQQQFSPLFIRGGFNNWGTEDQFTRIADNKWQVEIGVGLGTHEYKIATQDWQAQYMIGNRDESVVDAEPNQTLHFNLAKNATEDADLLWVEKAGVYRFVIDTQNLDSISVEITRVADFQIESNYAHNDANKQDQVFTTFDNKTYKTSFSFTENAEGLRDYVHSSEQPLRDPVPQTSQYSEDSSLPYLRTANVAFDSLFSLAIDEMKLDAVESIKDGAYNYGQAIPCNCFKTGEKWDYVWTRDLSYAAHLSLGLLDPQRVTNSLEFKLSGYRDSVQKPLQVKGSDDGLQIIQDTGSGGSWPISTDRVTWAFGAESALNNLTGIDREQFAQKAYKALMNTIEIDRKVIFDDRTGLYNGEQSFLDWREQTYADWIQEDLSSMATAKSISTNAAHYQALKLAEKLAKELGEEVSQRRYSLWAKQLKDSINQHLWLAEYGMYSSLTASHFDNATMPKFDWLGQSLAIVTGIATKEQQQQILANYPHGPMGAPVIFPQQPGIRVYHNRSIWPFVTAYGLKAAIAGNNVSVANNAYDTLIRGASLNMSNMENLEWLSGQPIWLEREDSKLSGPVINSKSQLWSVGGYLSMVIEGIFGVNVKDQGLDISPYFTTHTHQKYFNGQSEITLENLTWHAKKLNVTLKLPSLANDAGVYKVKSLALNNKAFSKALITESDLGLAENNILVTLEGVDAAHSKIHKVAGKPSPKDDALFAPFDAKLTLEQDANNVVVNIDDSDNDGGVTYQIYKNSQLVAANLTTKTWTDPQPLDYQACYSVSVAFTSSGNSSHHSPVVCAKSGEIISISDKRVNINSSLIGAEDGKAVLKGWGKFDDSLTVSKVNITEAGNYAIQVDYRNLSNKTNTGITAGVKWIEVRDLEQNLVASGVLQMPHTKATNGSAYSTPFLVELSAGAYEFTLTDFFNMSYLTNNKTYSQSGGLSGPVNSFDIYAFRVLPIK